MAEREYKRLTWARPRSGFSAFSHVRSSLWLGKDHLLGIDASGYTENYKRFYFQDIQAVIVRKSTRWQYSNLGLGVLTGLFILFAALARSEVVAAVVLGIIAGLFALALLLNLAGGPTCVCHLRTAVQTEELPSLHRLRRTRRVLERVRPLIVAAQGELRLEEIAARPQESPMPQSAEEASAARTSQPTGAEPGIPPRTTT